MIAYTRHILDNGLTLLCHRDDDTPLVTINLLYGVGSRNEAEHLTGFAHLFEHLMFGGTSAVPDYDRVISDLGGESNAFTNCDYTNYYLTVPAQHLETALQLEADRMRGLALTPQTLAVQQRVVTEEYHQRYLNQPYGDMWLLLRPLSYHSHPYRWCTIGADISHVQRASLDDVRHFFELHYHPSNAILSVAGCHDPKTTLRLVERLFGTIADGGAPSRAVHLTPEPDSTEAVQQTVTRNVPNDAIYRTYLMCDRHDRRFPAVDLITDLLSNGDSSRFQSRLMRQQGLFAELDACITGEIDRGLLLVSGKPAPGIDLATAEQAIDNELRELAEIPVSDYELQKVINKFESTWIFSHYRVADRAHALCYYQWIGDADLINSQPTEYRKVTPDFLRETAHDLFRPENNHTLHYRSTQP